MLESKSTESPQEKYERKQLKKHGVIPRPVVCEKCGNGGGTLVKAGEKYRHQGKCPK